MRFIFEKQYKSIEEANAFIDKIHKQPKMGTGNQHVTWDLWIQWAEKIGVDPMIIEHVKEINK